MMMMMISDPPRSNPTVQIPPWDPYLEDPAPYINSPAAVTNHGDFTQYDVALAALQRYLPSNKDEYAAAAADGGGGGGGGGDDDDFDIPVDAYSCDEFRMFEFKVKRCGRARSHDWTECPFAHPGEKARRRDPRRHHYSGSACPDFRRGACRRGDACEHAHGVFECWLHPARYRTQPCKDGTHCRRRVCFFAHTPEQLRILPYTAGAGDGSSPRSSAQYSPPSTPATASPPASPMSQLAESMRGMQINKMKLGLGMGMGMGLSMSPPNWGGGGYGSPCSPGKILPGFRSLPATPVRAVARRGPNAFDLWESWSEEEPAMERVESGRALRERIYSKLGKENSLDRVGQADSVPDFGWVSELVK
ncbi:zinc finger CCCH domain-containing protein 20-like [Salvia miltiorrhiza]|uniref:zinc finger CCCH domain-containing protein 20-like n=1 Tax=Salvia miltiorrhiza TaxID=226208 RepID=UPI0025AB6F81|nr:zinc finger CCCH domain-containing protein 20-like [Salvia miltiorrhiza]